ncbi:hypothetical protein DDE18_15635 [Nocardioides gansuensis]|uniref:Uncharacterized protein n=1 Tax=Nocardioides gansuensis TaxID=2138300 RepID=A0A2T8F8Q0_9ACTN|nr:hypothetical protein [Nocardioides gansuensis]PVG82108.1 hypothetical protein DDE18_15635 [Nocardioides gansuensis]
MIAHPTYRDHAELSATLFQRLVGARSAPAAQADVDRLLECRDIIVSSLLERLEAVGVSTAGTWSNPHRELRRRGVRVSPTPPELVGLAVAPAESVRRLTRVLKTLPRVPEDRRRAPSDVLDGASADATVNLWRDAARYVTSATATLTESAERPWETDDGTAWWLVRDVAALTEAVLVADADLDELGLLKTLDQSPGGEPRQVQRMLAAHCGRVANWSATSDAAEMAGRRERGWDLDQPRPVSQAADLPAAQRLLAGYLRVSNRGNAVVDARDPVIGLHTVRAMVTVQSKAFRAAIEWAEAFPELGKLPAELEQAHELVIQLEAQLPRVQEAVPQLPPRHTQLQAKEISDAVGKLQLQARLEGTPPISQDELVRWSQALHQTNVGLGIAMRREIRRPNTNFRWVERPVEDRSGPGRRSGIDVAAEQLAKSDAPTLPASRFIGTAQRAALSSMLAETPPAERVPATFPRKVPGMNGPGR